MGPPLGNGTLGDGGAIPGAGREVAGLPEVLAAAAIRATGVETWLGANGGAGLLSGGAICGAVAAGLGGDEGGRRLGVTGLTGGGATRVGSGGGATDDVTNLSVAVVDAGGDAATGKVAAAGGAASAAPDAAAAACARRVCSSRV